MSIYAMTRSFSYCNSATRTGVPTANQGGNKRHVILVETMYVYVCMYVYIYIYIHTYICICMYIL